MASQYSCDKEVCDYGSELNKLLRLNRDENYENGLGFIKSIIEGSQAKGKNWIKSNNYKKGDLSLKDSKLYISRFDNNLNNDPLYYREYWNEYQLPFFSTKGKVAGSCVLSGDGSTIRLSNEIISFEKLASNKFKLILKKDLFVNYPVFLFSTIESLDSKFYFIKNEGYNSSNGELIFSIWSSPPEMNSIIFEDSLLSTNTFSISIFGRVEPAGDIIPPVITLIGDNPQQLILNDSYIESGATAFDDVEGDLTSQIVIDSSAIDNSIIGTYTVNYSVSDSSGNIGTKTRDVNVVELVTECSTWNAAGFTTARSNILNL